MTLIAADLSSMTIAHREIIEDFFDDISLNDSNL